MNNRKPKSYKLQNACVNCKHVFKMCEYDCESKFYCTFDSTPRPQCGSTFMNEYEYGKFDFSKWIKWSKFREVDKSGICTNWEKKSGK